MAVTIGDLAGALRITDGGDPPEPQLSILTRLAGVADAFNELLIPAAPEAIQDECKVRFCGYLYDAPAAGRGDFYGNGWRNSGAASLASRWISRRAGIEAPLAEPVDPDEVRVIVEDLLRATKVGPLTVPDFDLMAGNVANTSAPIATLEAGTWFVRINYSLSKFTLASINQLVDGQGNVIADFGQLGLTQTTITLDVPTEVRFKLATPAAVTVSDITFDGVQIVTAVKEPPGTLVPGGVTLDFLAAAVIARLLPASLGTAAQVLTVNPAANAPIWADPAAAAQIGAKSITLDLLADAVVARLLPAALGTKGQILQVNNGATAAEWANPAGAEIGADSVAIVNLTAAVVARLLPGTLGTKGQILQVNNGATAAEWADAVAAEVGDGTITVMKLAAAVIARLLPNTLGTKGQVLQVNSGGTAAEWGAGTPGPAGPSPLTYLGQISLPSSQTTWTEANILFGDNRSTSVYVFVDTQVSMSDMIYGSRFTTETIGGTSGGVVIVDVDDGGWKIEAGVSSNDATKFAFKVTRQSGLSTRTWRVYKLAT